MAREGMLIQIDGSYHRWLGEDGPQFTLLLAVDDATGCVVSALFCEYENTRDYLLLMRDLIQSYGIPLALFIQTTMVSSSIRHRRRPPRLPPSSLARWVRSAYR